MVALHILGWDEGPRSCHNLSLISHIDIKSGWYIIRISGFTISLSAQIRANMYSSIDTFMVLICVAVSLPDTHDNVMASNEHTWR